MPRRKAARVCSCVGCDNCKQPTGCPDLVTDGKSKCEACRPKPWSGGDPEARARRMSQTASKDWDRLRKQLLPLHPVCYRCGERPSVQLDHIVPDFEGGRTEPSNLAGICIPCHKKKSAEEGARARWSG